MSNCCPNCFSDNFLKEFIKNNSKRKGKCDFCKGRLHQPLIDPIKLIDLFQQVFELYIEGDTGELINILLQRDWHIFSDKIENDNQLKLLGIIIDDRNMSIKKYLAKNTLNKAFINKWDLFAAELKNENRFFPKNTISLSQLSELFSYLKMPKSDIPKHLFRARIDRYSKNFTIDQMGKPPNNKSCDGRANPKGISYFYGASNEETAISETRPSKTDYVKVAKFKMNSEITLVDLRNPRETISPFSVDDDAIMVLHNEHLPFLVHLRDKLSQPILPHKTDLEYLATQYLCELIKDNNFNGIAYKSSLDNGDNYVIFDDSFLSGKTVSTFTVSDTTIKAMKLKK